MTRIVDIADLPCPGDPEGRTYRQVNAAKAHRIPLGALVEVDCPGEDAHGVRLFVVHHGRDCDLTPLYYLSPYAGDTEVETPGFRNPKWIGGYPEDGLRVVRGPAPEGTPS